MDDSSVPTTPIRADYGQQQQNIVQYQAYNSSSSTGGNGIFAQAEQKLLFPLSKTQSLAPFQDQPTAVPDTAAAAVVVAGGQDAVAEIIAVDGRPQKHKKDAIASASAVAADEGAVAVVAGDSSSSRGRSRMKRKHRASHGLHLPLAIATGLVAGAFAHLWRKREIYYEVRWGEGGGGGGGQTQVIAWIVDDGGSYSGGPFQS